MKKLIIILLMVSGIVSASEIKHLGSQMINWNTNGKFVKTDRKNSMTISTLCIDGYKYVVASDSVRITRGVGVGISITQMYKKGIEVHRPPQPIECE